MSGGISGPLERDASPQERAVDHRLRRAILAAAIEELQMWSFERFSVETVADRAAVDPDSVHRLWNSCRVSQFVAKSHGKWREMAYRHEIETNRHGGKTKAFVARSIDEPRRSSSKVCDGGQSR
jgi:hypothetical protein